MFSVLLSTYYGDRQIWLGEALESMLKQTILPQQFVVVADGPLPESHHQLITKYKKLFEKKFVSFDLLYLSENKGLGFALKAGANICKMPYVVRMDSDDISTPTRLEELKALINENPMISVFGAMIEEFNKEPGDIKRLRRVPVSHDSIVKHSYFYNPINHVTACIKRSSLFAVGSYETVLWHEDYFLWIKMIFNGYRFYNLNQVHVHVRVDGFNNRRSGLKYLLSEQQFAHRCVENRYWSKLNAAVYMMPRVLIRLLPNRVVGVVYQLLRTARG